MPLKVESYKYVQSALLRLVMTVQSIEYDTVEDRILTRDLPAQKGRLEEILKVLEQEVHTIRAVGINYASTYGLQQKQKDLEQGELGWEEAE